MEQTRQSVSRLEKGGLNAQCQNSIRLVSRTNSERHSLLDELTQYSIGNESTLITLKQFQCSLVRGQPNATYPLLSNLNVKIYRAPASIGGIEQKRSRKEIFITMMHTHEQHELPKARGNFP